MKRNIDSLVAAAVGFLIILLFTSHSGIGISPDSVVYFSGAENLKAKGSYIDFTGDAIIDFPVFYPILLATMSWLTHLSIIALASWLNAFVFATVIFLSGYMIEQFEFKTRWYKLALLAGIVFHPGLLQIYSMLWSETIFILLLVLIILAMHRYMNSGSKVTLIVAAVITALACITRYAGVCVVAFGGLIILLNTKFSWKKRFIDGFIFGIISVLLFAITIFRNYQVSETLTGYRDQSTTSFALNLKNTGNTFLNWLSITTGNQWIPVIIAAGIIFALGIICLKNYLKKKTISRYEDLSACFGLFYLVFIIATATISAFEPLNSRFLTPAFIFLLLGLSNWIATTISQISRGIKKIAFAVAVVIFFSVLFGQLVVDANTWNSIKGEGLPGYSEDAWKKSPTISFIEKDSPPFKNNYTIYSNASDAFFWFTHKPTKYLPEKRDEDDIQDLMDDPHCYVVWFNNLADAAQIDQKFLTDVKKMKLIKQLDDGEIYEFDGAVIRDKR